MKSWEARLKSFNVVLYYTCFLYTQAYTHVIFDGYLLLPQRSSHLKSRNGPSSWEALIGILIATGALHLPFIVGKEVVSPEFFCDPLLS